MDNKKENPLVSIALMTYNRAHYLHELIDCLLAQTFKDFELIIFDDFSPDETEKICKEYAKKDTRIKYVRPEENLNVPTSFKAALGLARGKYFMWVQDDDLYDKRFVEDCVNVHKEHPEFSMVFAGMVDIDKNGNVFKHLDPKGYMPFGTTAYERLKRQMLHYFSDGKSQLMCGLWKREVMLDDPLFGYREKDDYPPLYWGFENYFFFRNLAKGPVGFAPDVRFFRRSRVLEEYRPPRSVIPRLAITFYYRLKKAFGSPYFCYIARLISGIEELTYRQRFKLILWNLYVVARLFFARKI